MSERQPTTSSEKRCFSLRQEREAKEFQKEGKGRPTRKDLSGDEDEGEEKGGSFESSNGGEADDDDDNKAMGGGAAEAEEEEEVTNKVGM